MDANTVVATFTTGAALGSLAVSFLEGRAMRRHNRHSVRPILEFTFIRCRHENFAGLKLVNCGLGPAIITRTALFLDGRLLGGWDEATINPMRDNLPHRPFATALRVGQALPVGYERFLLYMEDFDRHEDAWFWELLRERIRVDIHYTSLYKGKEFCASTKAAG